MAARSVAEVMNFFVPDAPPLGGVIHLVLSVTKHLAIFTGILSFKRYSISADYSGWRQKNQTRLSATLQRIPPYAEVPPYSEAKRIISCFSAVLSY